MNKWIIIGFVFFLIETAWFGFDELPSCIEEQLCDLIAVALVSYGLGKGRNNVYKR